MHKLFLSIQLKPCDNVLKTYTSQKILVLGKFDVNVTYEDQEKVFYLSGYQMFRSQSHS